MILQDDSFIEGKLGTVVVGRSVCHCQLTVPCPKCGQNETVPFEVPSSLKSKLIPLILKNVRIVRAGGKWAVTAPGL